MPYLICEKCGGYYELKENESPDDFESCDCGRNLKYVQNINSEENPKSSYFNDVKVCPTCHSKNSGTSQICAICSEKLDEHENFREQIDSTSNNSKSILKSINEKSIAKEYTELIDIKAIIIGFIVFTFVFLIDSLFNVDSFFVSGDLIFLEALIGGFAAAYAAHPNYKSGILNGGLSGLVIIIMIFIIAMFRGITDILLYIVSSVNTIIPIIIFAIIGAFIGTYLKRLIINAKQNNRTDFLVCDNCEGYYELSNGESPENFANECECGGNLKYITELSDEELQKTIDSKYVFPPIISVILGVIVNFILLSSFTIVFSATPELNVLFLLLPPIFGGFIATYYTNAKKIKYGIYVGIIIITINFLLLIFSGKHLGNFGFPVFILLNAVIGSSIAKRVDLILKRKRLN